MHLNGYLRHLNTDGPRYQGRAVKCSNAKMTCVVCQFRQLHKSLTRYIPSTSTSQLAEKLWRAIHRKQGNNWRVIYRF